MPAAPEYRVAYSGGLDSHVLLHLLATAKTELSGKLLAVHVNHHIQQPANDWAEHCRQVCEQLGIPFLLLDVDGKARAGKSPEAVARAARYAALKNQLPAQTVVLTAQHQNDQAETLLLQLFRGAGPKGLAAMPRCIGFAAGWLLRPFLDIPRHELLDYAQQHGLNWIEDPSNADTRYDRNLLRQDIMPRLQSRWPGLTVTLARAAGHQSEQQQLVEVLAQQDRQHCVVQGRRSLSILALQQLSAARQRNVLRYWLSSADFSLPSRVVLERIRTELILGRVDSSPLVSWPGVEIRRFRGHLMAAEPLPHHDPATTLSWESPGLPVRIPSAGGVLSAKSANGAGLAITNDGQNWSIHFRTGGERLQPDGHGNRRTLKNLFQEWGVPEWERARIPLIYVGDTLAAVAGFCVCDGFKAQEDQPGLLLHWSRTEGW